ncbi:MAG: diadenylate cyclase [Acidimicrobiia bacterium]
MDHLELPVLPGRLQRLADELADEGLPAFDGVADPVAALVELAYALRPQRFEGRVPTYGALLPPSVDVLVEPFGEPADLVPVADVDVQFARRFADGVTSFAVRLGDGISHIACFTRNLADEYDLVGLQAAIGGVIVQRHPRGQVRLFGPAGVVRWDGVAWHRDPPVDAWIVRLRSVAPDLQVDGLRPLMRFAVHELAAQRIGATLIWRPTGDLLANRHEPLVHNAPRLRLDSVGEEAALAHALSQTDGAALFDGAPSLVALGLRLAPSTAAERAVGAMHGMRHTSALRYSHDDPDAVVIVVSEAGPVTLMHCGRAITSVDPADERIG